MKPVFSIISVVCLLYFSVSAQTAIALSGTVYDGAGDPISGATVFLNSDTTIGDTTNEAGEFSLISGTAVAGKRSLKASGRTIRNIGINNSQLFFYTQTPIKNGVSSIFTSSGKCIASAGMAAGKTGLHTCPLPALSAGMYLLKLSVNEISLSRKLVNTGKHTHISNPGVGKISGEVQQTIGSSVTEETDTLLIESDGFKPLKEPIASYYQNDLEIIMDYTKSPPIDVDALPEIEEMPDPLTMLDGTEVTTLEQWRKRRREMIRILEDYEYGHMPPPPGNVTASTVSGPKNISGSGTYRKLHLTFGPEENLGFDIGISTPGSSGDTDVNGFPVLINLTFSAGVESSSPAFSRGYAVVSVPFNDLGADSPNWKSTGFFPAYPEYDWHDFSAWAWGLSRVVDYLVTDPAIDKEKIMITGTSRLAQACLVAGAFDERIALTAPVAGGMAFRFSGKEMGGGLGQGITEVVDQNTYWFGPLFEEFRNKTPRLPCDQHWLPALTAPRLFILLNSLSDEYGRAYAAAQSYLGAKPVYEFLDAADNLGQHFRPGGHGMYNEDWEALLDFADQYLLGKEGDRRFDILPSDEEMP